jgi:hypothetical protein
LQWQDFRRYPPFVEDKKDESVSEKKKEYAQTILARPSRRDARSEGVASDYIVCLFASIIIRRPGLAWLCLSPCCKARSLLGLIHVIKSLLCRGVPLKYNQILYFSSWAELTKSPET